MDSLLRYFRTCLIILFTSNYAIQTAQVFPSGFKQEKLATIYYPTSATHAPDGRIFVTEKGGKVKIIKNGAALGTPFLQVDVETTNERGLSSVALDPDFSSNGYVYIYYTVLSSPVRNRLSRFTANGDVAASGSEVILLEFEPVINSIHNGGGLAFGGDGKLYLGVGNDDVNANSQDLNSYKGKILRLNKDGSPAPGNPFSGSEAASRIWAYGLRNPFSLSVQAGSGRLFVNDPGAVGWEEINDATSGGKNFGWPHAEGSSSNPDFTNPVYAYPHGTTNTTGCAISGGTFFNGAISNYPTEYTGKYFFLDYCNKWINYIDISGGHITNFGSNLPGALVSITQGKDGNLYYFSIGQNSFYKISYDSSIGINDYDKPEESLHIYPNPNNGKFYITLSSKDARPDGQRFEVINALGQTVFVKDLFIDENMKVEIELDKSLPEGLYFIKTGSKRNQEINKFYLKN